MLRRAKAACDRWRRESDLLSPIDTQEGCEIAQPATPVPIKRRRTNKTKIQTRIELGRVVYERNIAGLRSVTPHVAEEWCVIDTPMIEKLKEDKKIWFRTHNIELDFKMQHKDKILCDRWRQDSDFVPLTDTVEDEIAHYPNKILRNNKANLRSHSELGRGIEKKARVVCESWIEEFDIVVVEAQIDNVAKGETAGLGNNEFRHSAILTLLLYNTDNLSFY